MTDVFYFYEWDVCSEIYIFENSMYLYSVR